MKQKILVLGDINLKKLKNLFWNYTYITKKEKDISFIFIRGSNFKLGEEELSEFKNLKWIFVFWIWTDNINTSHCKAKWIFIETSKESIQSVSELSLLHLLNWLRFWTELNQKLKEWIYSRELVWNELSSNKNIWILWFWDIWKNTLNLLKNLWIKNLFVYDHNLDKKYKDNYVKWIHYEKSFIDFCKKINILILHINWKEENINLINKELLKWLNITHIINTSRKDIVNEIDIIDLLNSNKLSYYWTDVVIWEPNIKKMNLQLVNHPKVFITPHIWANTIETQNRIYLDLSKEFKNKNK